MITTITTVYVVQRRMDRGNWQDSARKGTLAELRDYRDQLVKRFPDGTRFRIVHRKSEITETVIE